MQRCRTGSWSGRKIPCLLLSNLEGDNPGVAELRSPSSQVEGIVAIAVGLFGWFLAPFVFCSPESDSMGSGTIEIYDAGSGRVERVEPVVRSEAEWKRILTPEQYDVMRRRGTERLFSRSCAVPASGQGIYECAACGTPLFAFGKKFESGTGWPSFFEPVSGLNIRLGEDRSLGRVRVEVSCARCGSHLGHVFDDGPPPAGKRYCINAVALRLREKGKE